jgi:hypothetical protein
LNSLLEFFVSPRTRVVIMTGAGRETVLSRKTTAVDEVISKQFALAEIAEVTVVEDLAAGITPSARRSNWGSS